MPQTPMISIFTAVSTALIAGAAIWAVSTLSGIPTIDHRVASLESRVSTIETRVLSVERETGPYRGDRR